MLYSFFFFKQKTAYEMRISDWSSDVCSSDLPGNLTRLDELRRRRIEHLIGHQRCGNLPAFRGPVQDVFDDCRAGIGINPDLHEIGRASCRERVCQYV